MKTSKLSYYSRISLVKNPKSGQIVGSFARILFLILVCNIVEFLKHIFVAATKITVLNIILAKKTCFKMLPKFWVRRACF